MNLAVVLPLVHVLVGSLDAVPVRRLFAPAVMLSNLAAATPHPDPGVGLSGIQPGLPGAVNLGPPAWPSASSVGHPGVHVPGDVTYHSVPPAWRSSGPPPLPWNVPVADSDSQGMGVGTAPSPGVMSYYADSDGLADSHAAETHGHGAGVQPSLVPGTATEDNQPAQAASAFNSNGDLPDEEEFWEDALSEPVSVDSTGVWDEADDRAGLQDVDDTDRQSNPAAVTTPADPDPTTRASSDVNTNVDDQEEVWEDAISAPAERGPTEGPNVKEDRHDERPGGFNPMSTVLSGALFAGDALRWVGRKVVRLARKEPVDCDAVVMRVVDQVKDKVNDTRNIDSIPCECYSQATVDRLNITDEQHLDLVRQLVQKKSWACWVKSKFAPAMSIHKTVGNRLSAALSPFSNAWNKLRTAQGWVSWARQVRDNPRVILDHVRGVYQESDPTVKMGIFAGIYTSVVAAGSWTTSSVSHAISTVAGSLAHWFWTPLGILTAATVLTPEPAQ